MNIISDGNLWTDYDGSTPPTGWTGSQYDILEVGGFAIMRLRYNPAVALGDTLDAVFTVHNVDPFPGSTMYLNVVDDSSATVLYSQALSDGLSGAIHLQLSPLPAGSLMILVSGSSGDYSTAGFYEIDMVLAPAPPPCDPLAVDDTATLTTPGLAIADVRANDTVCTPPGSAVAVTPVPPELLFNPLDGSVTLLGSAQPGATYSFWYRLDETADAQVRVRYTPADPGIPCYPPGCSCVIPC